MEEEQDCLEFVFECKPVEAYDFIRLAVRFLEDGGLEFRVLPEPDYLAITKDVVHAI